MKGTEVILTQMSDGDGGGVTRQSSRSGQQWRWIHGVRIRQRLGADRLGRVACVSCCGNERWEKELTSGPATSATHARARS